jgi:hypothetical protein
MKQNIFFSKSTLFPAVIAALTVLISACGHKKQAIIKKVEQEQHWAAVSSTGIGSMYLDKVPAKAVMQDMGSGDANTVFLSYKVGFLDSSHNGIHGKADLEKGKYYQYNMYRDWVALVDGDSVQPVFYQPMVKRQQLREEGILVFEIPKDKQIDTLVYTDSFGPWGRQVIINSKY